MSGDQRRRHLAAVDAARPQVTQAGNRVMVTDGPHAGRTGHVTGVRLARDDGGGMRRYVVVLLDGTRQAGAGFPHRFTEGLLRVLD